MTSSRSHLRDPIGRKKSTAATSFLSVSPHLPQPTGLATPQRWKSASGGSPVQSALSLRSYLEPWNACLMGTSKLLSVQNTSVKNQIILGKRSPLAGLQSLVGRELVIKALRSCLSAETPIRETDSRTAELCKYMENCFLAMKVAFSTQFYEIAAFFDVDFEELRSLWLLDPRIGQTHTTVYRGRGFGGHCLPKDLRAIIAATKEFGGSPLLEALLAYNDSLLQRITGDQKSANLTGETPVSSKSSWDSRSKSLLGHK